jgi:hypothetical protein
VRDKADAGLSSLAPKPGLGCGQGILFAFSGSLSITSHCHGDGTPETAEPRKNHDCIPEDRSAHLGYLAGPGLGGRLKTLFRLCVDSIYSALICAKHHMSGGYLIIIICHGI